MNIKEFENKALSLRRKVLDEVYRSKLGSIGSIFSSIELFTYLYYGKYGLRTDAEKRDCFILGKGHAGLAVYLIWEDLGFVTSGMIQEYGTNGGSLGGQMYIGLPMADFSSGSLGHAIGIAGGYAMADRIDGVKRMVVAFVGDGECAEGSIWEAVSVVGEEELSEVICVVDYNELGASNMVAHSGGYESFANRFISYGWNAYIIDGHSFADIDSAFEKARKSNKPTAVIARTIKGKGISFMERNVKWHISVPTEEEYIRAKEELERI